MSELWLKIRKLTRVFWIFLGHVIYECEVIWGMVYKLDELPYNLLWGTILPPPTHKKLLGFIFFKAVPCLGGSGNHRCLLLVKINEELALWQKCESTRLRGWKGSKIDFFFFFLVFQPDFNKIIKNSPECYFPGCYIQRESIWISSRKSKNFVLFWPLGSLRLEEKQKITVCDSVQTYIFLESAVTGTCKDANKEGSKYLYVYLT